MEEKRDPGAQAEAYATEAGRRAVGSDQEADLWDFESAGTY